MDLYFYTEVKAELRRTEAFIKFERKMVNFEDMPTDALD
jgi:hypothetical protein